MNKVTDEQVARARKRVAELPNVEVPKRFVRLRKFLRLRR